MLTFSVSKHLAVLTLGTSELGITAGGMHSSEFLNKNFGKHVNLVLAGSRFAHTAHSFELFDSGARSSFSKCALVWNKNRI